MADEPVINPMARQAVQLVEKTILEANAQVAQGMALLANVHTTALAVQGAALHLRQVSTVAVAALGAALRQILEGETERGTAAIAATQEAMKDATAHLQQVVEISQRVTAITMPTVGEPTEPQA